MAKAWALASRPQGMPAEANFELIDLPQRALADGEVRIANRWLSVDPYMRGRMNAEKSYVPPYALGAPMHGGAVDEDIVSGADGTVDVERVRPQQGWRSEAGCAAAVLTTLPAPTGRDTPFSSLHVNR